MTGRIGPNAIIQTVAVLVERVGRGCAAEILHRATGRALETMPEAMVDEAEVIALVQEVRASLPDAEWAEVFRAAGARTAEYLLAHRIPRLAQGLMRLLPTRLALRVLLSAIARHTWTFAGSARVTIDLRLPATMTLADCPMCRGVRAEGPCCHFYVGTLAHLARRLVAPGTAVREVSCRAAGAPACVIRFG